MQFNLGPFAFLRKARGEDYFVLKGHSLESVCRHRDRTAAIYKIVLADNLEKLFPKKK